MKNQIKIRMKNYMKSRSLFVLSKYVPLTALFILYNYTNMRGVVFAIVALLMSLIYWPILDYYRLKAIGTITNTDFWKCFNPFFRVKYYGKVVFGTQ